MVKRKLTLENGMDENFVEKLALSSHEIVVKAYQRYRESNNSTATTLYTNVSILYFLSQYWSEFGESLIYFDNIANIADFDKIKLVLCGKSCKESMEEMESLVAKEIEENKNCKLIEEKIKNLNEKLLQIETNYHEHKRMEEQIAEHNKNLSTSEKSLKDLREKMTQQEKEVRKIAKDELKQSKSFILKIGKHLSSTYGKIIQLVEKFFEKSEPGTKLDLHDVAIKRLNTTLSFNEKRIMEDTFFQIQITVKSLDDNKEFSNLFNVLGESKMWAMIEEINQFGSCVLSSLVRSLHTFINVSFETEREKEIKSEAISIGGKIKRLIKQVINCLLYTSPSPRDRG